MCRSIKTLREPYAEQVTEADMRAAALQYVRKISGFRAPAAHNADAFNQAVDTVARATADLLDRLQVRAGSTRTVSGDHDKAGSARERPGRRSQAPASAV